MEPRSTGTAGTSMAALLERLVLEEPGTTGPQATMKAVAVANRGSSWSRMTRPPRSTPSIDANSKFVKSLLVRGLLLWSAVYPGRRHLAGQDGLPTGHDPGRRRRQLAESGHGPARRRGRFRE